MPLFLVMIGGAMGAGIRFQIGKLMLTLLGPGFPWWTWTINLTGGLLMGLLTGLLARFGGVGGEAWRLLVGVGVLGGYTTFSTFSLEAATMIERGQWSTAILYVASSAIGAVLMLFVGLWITRAIPG